MEDQATIATIKDSKIAIESKMEKIKNSLKKFDGLDQSDKKKVSDTLSGDFKSLQQNINQMNNDIKQLKDESSEKTYGDMLTVFKQDKKKLLDEFEMKQTSMKNANGLLNDEKDKKINEMSSLELMNKGDKTLAASRQALNNMEKTTSDDIKIAKAINVELDAQLGKLDNAAGALKDMDASLGRATKQLGQMMKMYATDKMIMIMIIIIVLVIVGIIIASAVGGDPNQMFNAPHDIFGTKTTTNTTTTNTTTAQ